MKKKIKDSNSRRLSNITKVNHVSFLKDRSLQNEIKMKIKNGHMIVFKKFVDKKIINKLKKYLVNIGKNSLPGFEPISNHAKNHHRVVYLISESGSTRVELITLSGGSGRRSRATMAILSYM